MNVIYMQVPCLIGDISKRCTGKLQNCKLTSEIDLAYHDHINKSIQIENHCAKFHTFIALSKATILDLCKSRESHDAADLAPPQY